MSNTNLSEYEQKRLEEAKRANDIALMALRVQRIIAIATVYGVRKFNKTTLKRFDAEFNDILDGMRGLNG